jgi:hypothetical protein
VCSKPLGTPTSARAIPVIIFSAEPAVARGFLRRWTGEAASGAAHDAPDVREFIDWDYYKERLGSAIQKIITIPAAYQARARLLPQVCLVNPRQTSDLPAMLVKPGASLQTQVSLQSNSRTR